MKYKRLICAGIIVALALAAGTGHAAVVNLVNGNFDDETGLGLTGTQWAVYDRIEGWTAADAGVEVQRNTKVKAHSGDYYIELDSHGKGNTNSSIFTSVFLDAGTYELSFWYFARTNTGNNDNGIKALIGNKKIDSISLQRDDMDGWLNVVWRFDIRDKDAGYNDLSFAAFGKDNTLGGFIDTVSLESVPVPLPASFWLLGTGTLALAFRAGRPRN